MYVPFMHKYVIIPIMPSAIVMCYVRRSKLEQLTSVSIYHFLIRIKHHQGLVTLTEELEAVVAMAMT